MYRKCNLSLIVYIPFLKIVVAYYSKHVNGEWSE
jgi:hypothetical protein